jgi:hypothetical protein
MAPSKIVKDARLMQIVKGAHILHPSISHVLVLKRKGFDTPTQSLHRDSFPSRFL